MPRVSPITYRTIIQILRQAMENRVLRLHFESEVAARSARFTIYRARSEAVKLGDLPASAKLLVIKWRGTDLIIENVSKAGYLPGLIGVEVEIPGEAEGRASERDGGDRGEAAVYRWHGHHARGGGGAESGVAEQPPDEAPPKRRRSGGDSESAPFGGEILDIASLREADRKL